MFFTNEDTNVSPVDETSGIIDTQAYMEACLESAISALPDDERKAYMESDEFKSMEEAGVIGKKTVVRLTKMDDLSRRIKLACLQKAKEDNNGDYVQLKKVQAKRRMLLDRIATRYTNRVKRDAIGMQRVLLKKNPRLFTAPIR